MTRKRRATVLLLGRRGAMSRLALQMAKVGAQREDTELVFVLSRSNELIEEFAFLGRNLLAVDTIDARSPARTLRNLTRALRDIAAYIDEWRPGAVINLCPHVYTPLLINRIKRLGIPWISVMHDATGHPGDPGACLMPWFRMEARHADSIVTLSRYVADELARVAAVPPSRIATLFLPDLVYGARPQARGWSGEGPLKLLFFGRLLKYRGLGLLLEALEILRSQGLHVELTVAGAGNLAAVAERLAALRSEVLNRWIGEAEVGPLFSRHDALIASHLECSQSGAVAAAFGCGLPVIALPVGGLVEQVIDGRTGVLAEASDAPRLATAIRKLAENPDLYDAIRRHLQRTAAQRSTAAFLDALVSRGWPPARPPGHFHAHARTVSSG